MVERNSGSDQWVTTGGSKSMYEVNSAESTDESGQRQGRDGFETISERRFHTATSEIPGVSVRTTPSPPRTGVPQPQLMTTTLAICSR